MARARTIKPGFFTNEQLASCSPLARILFAGLWTIADRAGKLRDRPRKIKAELLPYEAAPDADAWLGELSTAALIVRYEADGERYIKIPGFAEHQNPHPREPPSEIPEPCSAAAGRVLALPGPAFNPSPLSPLPSPHVPGPRPARVGVGHPAYEAVEHWGVVWSRISPGPCLPLTTRQAQALGALCARLTPAEVMARMDRAVADPFWREKLTLDTLIDHPDRFAARVGRDVPKPAEVATPDPDPGCSEWGQAREKIRPLVRSDLWRWFRPLHGRMEGESLVLVAPDAFHADFMRDNYGPFLAEQAGRPVRLLGGGA